MDALLTAVPWTGLGWGGLIVLVILMVIRGDLVPRPTHEQIVTDLRESLKIERKNNERLGVALGLLANQYGTTTAKLFQALPLGQNLGQGQEQEAEARGESIE